jgi:hypothetical protein
MTNVYANGKLVRVSGKRHKRIYFEIDKSFHEEIEKAFSEEWHKQLSFTSESKDEIYSVFIIILDKGIRQYWELPPNTLHKLTARLIVDAEKITKSRKKLNKQKSK